jgi:hypothetical protein
MQPRQPENKFGDDECGNLDAREISAGPKFAETTPMPAAWRQVDIVA